MGSHSVETVAVSDVVYPPMEKYSFGSQGFPPVYTNGGEIPYAAPWREGKPWNRQGWCLLEPRCKFIPRSKNSKKKSVFLSAGEGFSMLRSYFRIKKWLSLKQEVLLSAEEVLLSKW